MPFKSDIWIYFNSKYKQTICNICGQIYKTNENITDLQTHLITKHYFVYKSLKNKPKQSQILREILSGKENIGSSIRPTDSSESHAKKFKRECVSRMKKVKKELHKKKNDSISPSKFPLSLKVQLSPLQSSTFKGSDSLYDKTEESYAESSLMLVHTSSDTQLPDSYVVKQLGPAVGIPTGSTSPPPSPQIEQNLSKHNPECSSSESRSTETGIKIIINSRYKCDDCDLQTKSTDIFIQHLFKEHIRKIIIKPEKSLSQKPTRHWPKIYYCCYCDFEGKIIKEMKWHIFEHFRFRCSVCSLECTNIESLHKHIVIHEDDRFKCSLCRYKGKSRSDIKMHMVEHTDKSEVVVCDKCGKKVRKRSLTIHLVKVHKLKFIKCLDCTLKFLTEEEFEIHFEKRHLGTCFVESIDHRTKRIGTRIFSCSNCLFKTKNERNFKLHQLKERFFSNGNRKLKKEKLRQFYSEKEKLEYLWCYIYATNENVKNKNFWNRIETLIDKRKIAESIKLEFLPVEWRLKLLNEWKSSFATKVSLFEKEVDAHILRCLKDSAPFRIRMREYYVGRKIQTVEDLLEVLYCYLFTFHKVFPKPYRKNRMRILLYKRGIIDRIKIDNKTNNCLVNVARSVLKGKTPITVKQIKDVKTKINEILVSALKSEDGDCSNYGVYYYENSDKELVLNKRNDKVLERDQNDIDMALKRDYKTRQVKELEPVSPDCLNTKGNIGKNAGPDVQETVILSVNASDSEAKANGSYIPKEEPSDIDIKLETLDDIDMKIGTMDAIIDTLVDISPESMKIINLISGQIITEIKSDYLDDTSEGTIEIMDLNSGQILTNVKYDDSDIRIKEEELSDIEIKEEELF